jgi:hypothetical protein
MQSIRRVVASLTITLLLCAVPHNVIRGADVTMQEGVVVSAAKTTLVIVDKQSKQHSYQVGDKVPVRINGKIGKLEDLKKTTPVAVTVDKKGMVTQVATIDLMKHFVNSRRYWR